MGKRIAFISVHECPLASSEGKDRGGINVYTYELGRALSRLGWHVDAFTRIQDDIYERVVSVNERFRVIHLPNGPHTPLGKQEILDHLPEFTGGLVQFAEAENRPYDLMHAHYYLSGLVAEAANKTFPVHIPVVMTYHTMGLMKQLVSRGDTQDPAPRISLERRLTTSLDHFVTASETGKEYLTTLYDADPERVSVIPPGVDTDLFRPIGKAQAQAEIGMEPDTKSILAVGRIDPVKGFDTLLAAIKILLNRHPALTDTLCLTIVGGDMDQDKSVWSKELTRLESLRRALNLTTTVRFIPPQPQERLPFYYNAADVVVMPSHYESFGMVALEAVACATPVIATDVTGISQVLKGLPQGHIVSANNPVALAGEIYHVLSNPHEKKRTTDLSGFTWDSAAGRMAEVYRRLTP